MTDKDQTHMNTTDESLDSDTLIQLLKEKAKELKTSQKKLKKVEDRFVEMHKSQKNLINDRETFIQFLHLVFPQNLLEDEIMLMPEGNEGYGMFDFNHLRQFWTLLKQNKENEQLGIMQAMQDEKRFMTDKIQQQEEEKALMKQQNNTLTASTADAPSSEAAQSNLDQLVQKNRELQEKLDELTEDSNNIVAQKSQQQDVASKLEDQYITQIQEMEQQLNAANAQNSEMKAQQLMNAFQSQGTQGSGSNDPSSSPAEALMGQFSAISDLKMGGNDNEIQSLKQQMSKKTNEILQLHEDKIELQQQIDDQKAEISELQQQLIEKPLDPNLQTDDVNQSEDNMLNSSKMRNSQLQNPNMSTLSVSLINDIDHQQQLIEQIEQKAVMISEKDEEIMRQQNHAAELEKKLQKLLGEFASTRTKAQQMLAEKNDQIQKLRQKYGKKDKSRGRSAAASGGRSSQIGADEEEWTHVDKKDNFDSSDSDSDNSVNLSGKKKRKSRFDKHDEKSQFNQIDTTSKAYIKNVLLKYFEYQAEGQEKEMLMMEKVLFTVLQIQSDELKSLKDIRVKSYNQGYQSYIWAADADTIVAKPVKTLSKNSAMQE